MLNISCYESFLNSYSPDSKLDSSSIRGLSSVIYFSPGNGAFPLSCISFLISFLSVFGLWITNFWGDLISFFLCLVRLLTFWKWKSLKVGDTYSVGCLEWCLVVSSIMDGLYNSLMFELLGTGRRHRSVVGRWDKIKSTLFEWCYLLRTLIILDVSPS